MHYRHSYHAGNFADVFKHLVLCGLLAAVNRKHKPWCYVDTHAGAGIYDLSGEGASRTGEWREGIGRLADLKDAPEPLATYLSVVRSFTPHASHLTPHVLYPGSPLFAQALARPGDRLLLCEKVPEVAAALRSSLRSPPPSPSPARGGGKRVGADFAVHQRDGYESHSLLPPAEKRGLILMDPPFERPDEFAAIQQFLKRATERFAAGTYAIWYPLKNRHAAARFERRAAALAKEPPLRIEFDNGAPGQGQLRACALLLLNAPFNFETDLRPALTALKNHLAQGPRAKMLIETVRP